MVVLEACQCEEGLGLSHSHVPERALIRNKETLKTFHFPIDVWEMNKNNPNFELVSTEPPSIRIWIDWREYAEVTLRDG